VGISQIPKPQWPSPEDTRCCDPQHLRRRVLSESMVAISLVEAILERFGSDHMKEILPNYRGYLETTGQRGQE